jgi:regulator of sigma E protease
VRFAGDENAASVPDQNDLDAMRRELLAREGEAALHQYFHFKPLWQRAIITAAGPVANFLLTIGIFAALLLALGEPITPARIDSVRPGSPAARAGFHVGDIVERADGRTIKSFGDIQMLVLLSSDTPIDFVVSRAGRPVEIVATLVRDRMVDQLGREQHLGALGLGYAMRPGDLRIQRYGPVDAVVAGATKGWDRIATTIHYVGRMLTGRETAEQLSGPLGMAQISGALAKQTAAASPDASTMALNLLIAMLELVANISVGIGFLNLMPIPVLDGGHLLFYVYEAVARRPLAAKVQAAGYRVGLALVLGLMLFATWNDLQRLRVFNLFGGLHS